MITWVLVFWLNTPDNYTVYEKYSSEKVCRDEEQKWNRRLQIVKSKINASCIESEK
jgi:hypothetical protein